MLCIPACIEIKAPVWKIPGIRPERIDDCIKIKNSFPERQMRTGMGAVFPGQFTIRIDHVHVTDMSSHLMDIFDHATRKDLFLANLPSSLNTGQVCMGSIKQELEILLIHSFCHSQYFTGFIDPHGRF